MRIECVITTLGDEKIIFDNGKEMTYYHEQDCCESVWADFHAIKDDFGFEYKFEEPLLFEAVEGFGFRFGNPGKMVSVPCYDQQNGYYSSNLTICYDGKPVLEECPSEWVND